MTHIGTGAPGDSLFESPDITGQYGDVECEGCRNGEDCYGWTSETLMCPSRIAADRELDAHFEAVRDFEDERPGAVVR